MQQGYEWRGNCGWKQIITDLGIRMWGDLGCHEISKSIMRRDTELEDNAFQSFWKNTSTIYVTCAQFRIRYILFINRNPYYKPHQACVTTSFLMRLIHAVPSALHRRPFVETPAYRGSNLKEGIISKSRLHITLSFFYTIVSCLAWLGRAKTYRRTRYIVLSKVNLHRV